MSREQMSLTKKSGAYLTSSESVYGSSFTVITCGYICFIGVWNIAMPCPRVYGGNAHLRSLGNVLSCPFSCWRGIGFVIYFFLYRFCWFFNNWVIVVVISDIILDVTDLWITVNSLPGFVELEGHTVFIAQGKARRNSSFSTFLRRKGAAIV